MSGAATLSALMSAFAWRAISGADAVKRGRVTLRLMLSQQPWPRNLAGLGAPACTGNAVKSACTGLGALPHALLPERLQSHFKHMMRDFMGSTEFGIRIWLSIYEKNLTDESNGQQAQNNWARHEGNLCFDDDRWESDRHRLTWRRMSLKVMPRPQTPALASRRATSSESSSTKRSASASLSKRMA